MFSSCECEIIDINSDNTSIHLHSVASLQAENVEAVSGRSIMIIEKCMGVLSNFTIDNNIAAGRFVLILK